jgi:hypothetical protein
VAEPVFATALILQPSEKLSLVASTLTDLSKASAFSFARKMTTVLTISCLADHVNSSWMMIFAEGRMSSFRK